jgi:hypothetical protein
VLDSTGASFSTLIILTTGLANRKKSTEHDKTQAKCTTEVKDRLKAKRDIKVSDEGSRPHGADS